MLLLWLSDLFPMCSDYVQDVSRFPYFLGERAKASLRTGTALQREAIQRSLNVVKTSSLRMIEGRTLCTHSAPGEAKTITGQPPRPATR